MSANGSLATKPLRAKIHRCLLWSKSGQTRAQLDCPLCAMSKHHRVLLVLRRILPFREAPTAAL
jgi:hypothetical protein